MKPGALCGILFAAVLLAGCAGTGGGMIAKNGAGAAPEDGASGGVNLAEFMGAGAVGATAMARDPRSGEQVEAMVDSEYLAGTGETCRSATLTRPGDKATRQVAACRGRDGWALLPDILSAPGATRR